ncbi:MAG: polyketide synthase dehydratase domain-containing protein, partial [Planctomycetes bacterium]|nr:polyketide synthase dehydratase domain-containing protein [Planctomycetota bacterium]
RNLRQFSEAGFQATYHACDIRDMEGLATTLQSIRETSGPIAGILHGAGVEAASRFVRKKPDAVVATIASKCDGAAHLISLTQDDPLQCFVSFGSTSGRFGGLGQADYSLASDLLAKMMDRLAVERPACRSVCFHWPAWDDVGMAVRPESKMALQSGGVSFMPSLEGVAHLIAELQSQDDEREILILDKPEPLDTDGTMSRKSPPAEPDDFRSPPAGEAAVPVSRPAAVRVDDTDREPADATGSRMPLIDRIFADRDPGTFTAEMHLDGASDPFLVEHRFRKKPIVPIVMAIEMFAEAAVALRPGSSVTAIRDVQIINALYVDPNRPHPAKIRLVESEGGFQCKLVGPFFNSRGEMVDAERAYVSGRLEIGQQPPQLQPIEPGSPVFDWFPFLYPKGMDIYHGEPFHTLVKVDYIHGGGRAVLKGRPANELIGERSGDGMRTAAAMLDGCLVACGAWGYAMLDKFLEIPAAIGCYRQTRLPREGEDCILRLYLREHRRDQNVYDMILMGASGDVVFQVEGYRSTRVAENS